MKWLTQAQAASHIRELLRQRLVIATKLPLSIICVASCGLSYGGIITLDK
jgi:hypothetical protein